jgi:uncharacterized membrane protein YcfT
MKIEMGGVPFDKILTDNFCMNYSYCRLHYASMVWGTSVVFSVKILHWSKCSPGVYSSKCLSTNCVWGIYWHSYPYCVFTLYSTLILFKKKYAPVETLIIMNVHLDVLQEKADPG